MPAVILGSSHECEFSHMKTIFPVQTENLILTPFTASYLTQKYVNWLNDQDVVQYSEQRHKQHTLASCKKYFNSMIESNNIFIAIIHNEHGHIGNISLAVDMMNSVIDISILIGEKKQWGKGFGLEAWSGIMDALFKKSGIRKITAGTMSCNQGMLRVMQKSGMQMEGRKDKQFILDGKEIDMVYFASFSNKLKPST